MNQRDKQEIRKFKFMYVFSTVQSEISFGFSPQHFQPLTPIFYENSIPNWKELSEIGSKLVYISGFL